MKETRDIEWLVNWALQAQNVERAIKNATPMAQGQSSQPAFEQMARLGVRVDSSRKAESWGNVDCQNDAVIIYDLIQRLPRDAAGLVVIHGRAGTRPDWCVEGVGCEVPVLTAKGKPRRIYRDPIKSMGDLGPMMEWIGHRQETVDFHRAQYAVWYQALSALVPFANKELEAYQAERPKASPYPWDWSGVVHSGIAC